MAKRKPTNKYYFSVEGETEQWYLKWLQDTINNTEKAACKVSIDCPVRKNPLKHAKSLTVTRKIEIYHFFDYESDEPLHVKGFQEALDNMKKAEKIGTISSEQMDSIKNGVVKPSVPVDKGLIGRAVKEKEKTQLENTIQVDSGEPVKKTASKKKHKKDPDIKTDSEGNEYVQATMKFDEDFEITEF